MARTKQTRRMNTSDVAKKKEVATAAKVAKKKATRANKKWKGDKVKTKKQTLVHEKTPGKEEERKKIGRAFRMHAPLAKDVVSSTRMFSTLGTKVNKNDDQNKPDDASKKNPVAS